MWGKEGEQEEQSGNGLLVPAEEQGGWTAGVGASCRVTLPVLNRSA